MDGTRSRVEQKQEDEETPRLPGRPHYRQQGTQTRGEEDGMGEAAMAQQVAIAYAERKSDDIQIGYHRANRTDQE